jgi:phage/plasmid-associated DNA primase
VDKDNTCSVDPSEFEGFNMETMAGKLVNYDTDINTRAPMRDSIIKKIEDRVPMRIRRKGIKDIHAPLPAIHIFGGNDIPPTLDGASRAHDRRWTFIKFDKVLTDQAYDRDYAQTCFDHNPQGVLSFAIEGLVDLLNAGLMYANPTSGKEEMEEWQLANDPVGQFLEALDAGEVLDGNTALYRLPEGRVLRARFYTLYREWCITTGVRLEAWPAHRFYKRLVQLGVELRRFNDNRYVVGFAVGAGISAKM